MAMERLKSCESVITLSEELRIHRTLLYKCVIRSRPWRVRTDHPPIRVNENFVGKSVI